MPSRKNNNLSLNSLNALNSSAIPDLTPRKFEADRGRLGRAFLTGLTQSQETPVDLGGGVLAFAPDFSPVNANVQNELNNQQALFQQQESNRLKGNLSLLGDIIEQQGLNKRNQSDLNFKERKLQTETTVKLEELINKQEIERIKADARADRERIKQAAKDAEVLREADAALVVNGVSVEDKSPEERVMAFSILEQFRKKVGFENGQANAAHRLALDELMIEIRQDQLPSEAKSAAARLRTKFDVDVILAKLGSESAFNDFVGNEIKLGTPEREIESKLREMLGINQQSIQDFIKE